MLVTNWEAFGNPKASARFFVHRLVRIYPPYWLALVPIALVYFFARGQFMNGHDDSNTDLLASLLLYPEPVHKTLFPLAWTLAFEMTFYIFFTALLFMKRRHIWLLVLAWGVTQLALFYIYGSSSNPYLRYVGNLQPMEFLFGIVIGLLYKTTRMPYRLFLFFVGIATSIAVFYYCANYDVLPFVLNRVVAFGIPGALLLYGAVAFEKAGTMISPLWLVAIGDASYATYLWHFSIIGAVRYPLLRFHPSGRVEELVIIGMTLIVIQLFSTFVYKVFEAPVTRTLNSFAERLLFGHRDGLRRFVT